MTLALVSVATLMESLYFTCFAFLEISQGTEWASGFFFSPSYWLIARLLVSLGSLLISILILRHLITSRR